MRGVGLGPVDSSAGGGQRRLPAFRLVSPNDFAFSGGEPQAKRGGLAVRCKAWLGAVRVP